MPADTIRLHRLKLIGVRVLWIVLALMLLVYLITGLPPLFVYYGLPCDADLDFTPFCFAMETILQSLGLGWGFFAWYNVIWIAIACAPFFVFSSLIAWRKRSDSKTLLFSIALLVALIMNANYELPDIVVESYPAARVMVSILGYLGQIGPMLFYVFPDGRFVPRWTRWAAAGFAVLLLVDAFQYWGLLPSMEWSSDPINIIVWIIFPLTLAYALLYRYRKASNPEQRQQIKWIVWAAALGNILQLIDTMLSFTRAWFNWDATIPTWYAVYLIFVVPPIYGGMALLACVGFYVAILRFRLWDIDFYINRSLVYGGLTVLMSLVFAGVSVGTQVVLGVLMASVPNGVTSVVSTLVVIALFLPTRDRLQRFVDSRVYGVNPNHERAVQAAIAQERDRLSQELHDSVTQSLYGLTIMAESGQRLAGDDVAREPLIEIGSVARQALREMRLLIHELRPPVLEEDGLLSALHQRLAAVERRSGIETNLVIEEVVDLPVVMEEVLYYIAIEALNNAIKHASAISVKLSLRTSDRWVELEIADDGKGFDPGADGSKGGMGLIGMRKRAEELGGTLTISSAPGQGTKVTARVAYHTDPRKRGTKAAS